jgi:RND family efflux transporter MFP subunit
MKKCTRLFQGVVLALILLEVPCAWAEAPRGNANADRIRTLVVAAKDTIISSQMAGRITYLRDQVGSTFGKGQRLAAFDCAEVVGRLQMAQAELDTAQLTLKTKQELLSLQSAGETEVALAGIALNKAKAQVALSRAQVGYCTISAPFNGIVVKAMASPYQSVAQGQPLIEIVSQGTPKAKMNVPSRWLSWLKPGTLFQFTADETGNSHRGKITLINGRVDAVSQTAEVEGFFVSAKGLKAGMSGYAAFEIPAGKR